MDDARPFQALFERIIPNLGPPDADGWAVGDCPYCGDKQSLRANVITGRWTCVPAPPMPAQGPSAIASPRAPRREEPNPWSD